ncbi:phosphotransferase enzyme family protein [Cerasicoccus fimbriatus]|uniref:phosphotransferase enzyme family protein n=1 Tax=Cerasicoccus fimbriatus TaxID=3014554 RepID=UPI0022B2B501|nr:phosphotransferase [Cerasicoccus sp. TK19100]
MRRGHHLAETEPYQDALYRCLDHWGLQEQGAELIRHGINHVFAAQTTGGSPVIVRVSDGSARPRHELEAELMWLNWLIKNDCVVTTPIASQRGELLETTINDDGVYHISCFERFAGHSPDPGNPAEWNDDLFAKIGRSVGRIHRFTDQFQLPPDKERKLWWDMRTHQFTEDTSAYDPATVEAMQAFLADFKNRARAPRHFGLIHHDVHGGNLLIENGEVEIIDFDLACYGWRMTDFAVLLYSHYYFQSWAPKNVTPQLVGQVVAALARGYREEYTLDDAQLAMLPDLLRLRETLCYIVMRPAMDYWNEACHRPETTVAQSMACIEERWRTGAAFDINFGD